jgi:hypothetical protein
MKLSTDHSGRSRRMVVAIEGRTKSAGTASATGTAFLHTAQVTVTPIVFSMFASRGSSRQRADHSILLMVPPTRRPPPQESRLRPIQQARLPFGLKVSGAHDVNRKCRPCRVELFAQHGTRIAYGRVIASAFIPRRPGMQVAKANDMARCTAAR